MLSHRFHNTSRIPTQNFIRSILSVATKSDFCIDRINGNSFYSYQHITAVSLWLGQFNIPDTLKVPPISERGNVAEIIHLFGSPEQLNEAVNELETLLYSVA